MALKALKAKLAESTIGHYVESIKSCPREIIDSRRLFLSAAMYATSALPITWDQGSSSVISSLPGFQNAFGITSATHPTEVSNFISFVYIGAGVGAALSYFLNDRIGRLWSFRWYMVIWIMGQVIATFSSGNIRALYAARIVSGLGIGALTVIGPVGIVEIAPSEMRGLLSAWFSVVMLLSPTLSVFVVMGVYLHIASSYLQYQVVFFVPTIIVALIILGSFFLSESPRWLFLVNRSEEGIEALVALRGLPATHPYPKPDRVTTKIRTEWLAVNTRGIVQGDLPRAIEPTPGSTDIDILRTRTSVRCKQCDFIFGTNPRDYGTWWWNGPFVVLDWHVFDGEVFFLTIISSFFFIDLMGRRKSLFTVATLQMVSHIYIAIYIKYKQSVLVSTSASKVAIAAIFIHGFGYAVGLLILPYVFGAEIWPTHLRSFGSAMSQCFHWLFFFAINKSTPSLLAKTDNWGAFLFFAAWCLIAIIYAYFVILETAGERLEHFDEIFEQPLWKAYRGTKRPQAICIEACELPVEQRNIPVKGKNESLEGVVEV
ncbi:uncharacterized protein N7479_006078 [Penicillium vulpinum]|uniref:uncharacterized protein n=1 Tax=Penicillium vulpinum TaxID=29845 RepID=UPI002548F03C|nr:uncharacterized protein N7479_006078 [Penicillium vulpinum]KAJ5958928.1 hypothetical protein N7479_006078 [Penicillium vulpinum]